ncbi:GGDEF domain-containing protein [Hoeflea sp. WL0058]|uniref:diguanylate cyclase n=1 Tax=Flavimaribacter sediminis TaxID=2865987 RepID=A0AAE2ZQR2_9HYPH|nr:GGDEF domain-containing protein [Flavimaribacter sediminis]MBW8639196.1 GGDEF domain-containing protein [Flavimaribacter sediminis]
MKLDWSSEGWARVYAFTALGTLACIGFAFAFDSYSFEDGSWRWGSDPINNLLIPLILAPPLFLFILSKMRQLAIAHTELMTVAATDPLTSLLNRRAFTEMVDGYLNRVEEASAASHNALFVIDVDHFKAVNDRFGHDYGDKALQLIAEAIAETVHDTDLVGRIGGEEFCVFMPRKPSDHFPDAAERIRSAISEVAFVVDEQRHVLSVSVGGVIFERGAAFSDLYRGADERLYLAKRNGRNRVELSIFSPQTTDPLH